MAASARRTCFLSFCSSLNRFNRSEGRDAFGPFDVCTLCFIAPPSCRTKQSDATPQSYQLSARLSIEELANSGNRGSLLVLSGLDAPICAQGSAQERYPESYGEKSRVLRFHQHKSLDDRPACAGALRPAVL